MAVTYGNEVHAQDHDAAHQQRRRLAQAAVAKVQQQQGDQVCRNLRHRWQEAVEVRVAVKVGRVEDQSVVADGDDEPVAPSM